MYIIFQLYHKSVFLHNKRYTDELLTKF